MRKRPPSLYAVDMTGQTFGFLTVLRREGSTIKGRKKKYAAWRCRCTCGQEVVLPGQRLRRGASKACAKNGHRWIPHREPSLSSRYPSEYGSWESLRRRCLNPRHHKYKRYGGRGIIVCDEWDFFENFLKDLGPKPTPEHTIERIDVNGNYGPGNCRWATRAEQTRNQERSVYVEHNGERLLLMDLAARLGLSRNIIYQRLKLGWSLDDALFVPVREKKDRLILPGSEVPRNVVVARLRLGWTERDALIIPVRPYRQCISQIP